ncbi:MAG: hypothetical protein PHE55_14830 [Methylococcaceae bacterium]|nr:hypothetical protein [Methylococcaceae bacterium]
MWPILNLVKPRLPLACGIQRVLEPPLAREQAFIGLFQHFVLEDIFRVDAFDQIEEEQTRKLFCIGHGIGIAAAVG